MVGRAFEVYFGAGACGFLRAADVWRDQYGRAADCPREVRADRSKSDAVRSEAHKRGRRRGCSGTSPGKRGSASEGSAQTVCASADCEQGAEAVAGAL